MLNKITNNVAAPIQKQAVKNSTKSGSDFQFALNKQTATAQVTPKNVGSIELNKDGSFILLGDVIAHNPDVKPATVESLQADFGMTKAEAEEILRPKPVLSAEEEQRPQEMKAYLMSKQVDVVARDAEGNIVAKIYKDGSLMCSNELGNSLSKCNSNAERIRLLEKNSNVVVSDYTKTKVTDFDLLKEEVALQEKNMSLHPKLPVFNTQEERDFYNTQQEVFEFQKRILAA